MGDDSDDSASCIDLTTKKSDDDSDIEIVGGDSGLESSELDSGGGGGGGDADGISVVFERGQVRLSVRWPASLYWRLPVSPAVFK